MDKSPKKSAAKTATKPSQKPSVLPPKPKDLYKTTSKGITTKDKKYANEKTEVINNSDDEILVKRERSLSDGSVKSLSWVCSDPPEENNPEHQPVKRTRSNTTNKEIWVLPTNTVEKENKSAQSDGNTSTDRPLSPEPVKPPRPKRENSFKRDLTDPNVTGDSKIKQNSPESEPVKPPRRKLPQPPRKDPPAEQKQATNKDQKEERQRDVISKPIVTSTPFQKNMTLAVENDSSGDGRRVFSIYDDSTDTKVQQGQSFYDFLYSDERSSQAGALTASQIRDVADDNIYDEVPLESSSQSLESVDRRTSRSSFGIYDEVIVNKEHYMMPVDNTDELSDWGSDFDDDDDDFDIDADDNIAHNIKDDEAINDDDEDGDSSGSGSYEEYKNSSATFYSKKGVLSSSQQKSPFKFRSDNTASGRKANLHVHLPGLKGIKGCFGMSKAESLPYLAKRKSQNLEQEQDEEPEYADPNIADTRGTYQQPVMPEMAQGLSKVQVKRHQIVKFILESEADYMKLLDRLIKKYELPVRERDLLDPSKIDAIFQGIHKVLDCHVMFNIALSARMDEWSTEEKIGDILYALFCKSMVLEAYSSYVNNFAKAMETVRSACKTHLAFAQLLKARRQSCRERTTLHSLMLKPTKRFPQFIDLVQELLKVTPVDHPDRIPLQMALTQLEYLADNLNERKLEAELRQKVKQLDASTAHVSKPLSAGSRYFIRQDDFVQCVIQDDTIVRTKKQRIIMLSDMLLCVSAIKGKKDRMTNFITDVKAKYKLKWNVPLSDVEVIEYGPGINLPYALPQGTNTTAPRLSQHRGCQEHFADLQHDLAVIGQIAGLVATLRRSYQVVDNDKVQKWHKAVQRTIEEESQLANMFWLELSLPAKSGRVNYIFSTESPTVKAEWLTALSTAVLRLAPENNPGWYLPEDNGTGEVAIQRRNMPLLKDNLDLFLLNPKARVKGIVTCPDASNPLPGICDNYDNLWLFCGGHDSTGFVSVIRVSCSSPPQIIESFHVCDSQILCGEFVERTYTEDKKVTGPLSGKLGFPFPTVWLGTQSGKIYIYNGANSERRYVMSVKLPDSVLGLIAVKRKVFASLADGSLVVFKPNKEGIWDFSKPEAFGLSKLPVMCMALVAGTLWCGSGNNIHIFDYKKEIVKHVIEVDPNVKSVVHHLVCYGIGVWISLWKQPTIKLYHSETREHVQDMNIAYTVNTMQHDIDSQFGKKNLDKLYVSCMDAEEGLLWVGTSVGLVLIFPLPRLEGIPLVSGRACVSFHAYQGRVRSLCPLKNNPDAEVTIGPPSNNKKRYQLFREHVMRDACVQTDPRICGTDSYAANGPEPTSKVKNYRNSKVENEEEEEDVNSDDDFNFVDEKTDCLPTSSQAGSVGSLSVRITSRPAGAGEDDVVSEFVNKVPDLGDTDFVKMMEDFQGFGSLPNVAVPDPPDVSAVFISSSTKDEGVGAEKARKLESTTQDKRSGDKVPPDELIDSSVNKDISTENPESGVDASKGRISSQGQYVELTISQAMNSTSTEDITLEMTSVRDQDKTGNDVYSPPSYVEVINTPKTNVFSSDSDNEDINESDPVFTSSVSGGIKSPNGTENEQKTGVLKSRLLFPVFLVTAGEGHADLRRKKPDLKSNDSRIMIWQIN